MGSLTKAPIPVGKVTVYSTFLGTKNNGDIVIDVCTRFSYPNLYNSDFTSSYSAGTPSQQIDLTATSEDLAITCCDLYKINNQDLEFHMHVTLKNYDPSNSKQHQEEFTDTSNNEITQGGINSEADKPEKWKGKRYKEQPYVFASCENEDIEEPTVTYEASDELSKDDSDPLELSNRIHESVIKNFHLKDVEDTKTMILIDGTETTKQMEIGNKLEQFESVLETEEEPISLKHNVTRYRLTKESNTYYDGDKEIERTTRYKCGRIRNKKTRCIFCYDDVLQFHRHLIRKHGKEKEVMAFTSLPKDNKKRAILIGVLRKRGNLLKISENVISPVRRPREGMNDVYYQACTFCKGLYNAKYLRRHYNRCPLNTNSQRWPRYKDVH